ncbi:MAG: HAMP domain-containing histidine kinase [Clostridiales bacterium]|jgi:signal transduction histidine kinase|nr:HAMP domain-containing histidine kinase [Clostridiales bacterium]
MEKPENKGKNKKKRSIQTHILTLILFLIVGVFLIIILAFNVSVNSYIKNTAGAQLDSATGSIVQIEVGLPRFRPGIVMPFINRMGTQAEMFNMSANYDLLDVVTDNTDKKLAIIQSLKDGKNSLDNDNNFFIKTINGDFYVKLMQNSANSSMYMVFYVDVTGIRNFAQSINIFLLITLAAAGLITIIATIIFARRITKPIKNLCDFANKIGTGDFNINEYNFSDREIDELSDIMNQAAIKLDIYDKDQKTFFQNVSHELRTPLMSIKCYAEGIVYGVMEKEEAGQVIVSETDNLSNLVEDLLYISRIDNISKNYIYSEYDLRESLSNSAQRQKSIADKENVEFNYHFDSKPVMFPCDEKHLTRAFDNLISNAIRYAESSIILSCHKLNDEIIISIEDDGCGIAEKDIPHVFDRFYKGENGKHGIGLSIVKSIIEQHKGTITAENAGKGAIFTIKFDI